jgi:ASC-1-like (ASCH) protein
MLDEKALQKIFKNSTRLVFNSRTKIITDGIFTIKNYSTVKFTKDILSALFPKIKDIREYKNFNSVLNKPETYVYEKTCIIIEFDKIKGRIYKSIDTDNIIVIDDKYTQYFPLYLYAYKDFKIICYNEKTRNESNFMVMGVKYYDTLTEAYDKEFLL